MDKEAMRIEIERLKKENAYLRMKYEEANAIHVFFDKIHKTNDAEDKVNFVIRKMLKRLDIAELNLRKPLKTLFFNSYSHEHNGIVYRHRSNEPHIISVHEGKPVTYNVYPKGHMKFEHAKTK